MVVYDVVFMDSSLPRVFANPFPIHMLTKRNSGQVSKEVSNVASFKDCFLMFYKDCLILKAYLKRWLNGCCSVGYLFESTIGII